MKIKNKKKFTKSPASIFRIALNALFLLWMVLGNFPTGWIYDLGAGTGAEPGQKPDPSVAVLTERVEVKTFFFNKTPGTINSDTLIPCPLLRLRDPGANGIHYTNRSTGNQRIEIAEYHWFDYPISKFQKVLKPLGLASLYNSYYLAQLEDGTYIGVFFDDYLMLGKRLGRETRFPAGYVRYASNEEKKMLNVMAADYDLDTVYILDMYNHEKSSWMIDILLRLVLASAILFVCFYIGEKLQGKISGRNVVK